MMVLDLMLKLLLLRFWMVKSVTRDRKVREGRQREALRVILAVFKRRAN